MTELPRIRYARTADGLRIAYAVLGSGPPLLSAFAGHPVGGVEAELRDPQCRAWYESLASRHTVLAFDPRGFGGSGRTLDFETLSPGTLIGDAEAVLDEAGIESCDLLATFRWAPSALEWASRPRSPLRSLILWHPFSSGQDALSQPRVEALRRAADASDFVAYWEVTLPVLRVPVNAVTALADACVEAVDPETYRQVVDSMRSWDVSDRMGQISRPTLVLRRADERVGQGEMARSIVAAIPNAELVVLGGDEFLPMHGDSEAVVEAITRFTGTDTRTRRSPSDRLELILFTDLAGSTAMQSRLGDAQAREVVRTHDAAMRVAIEEFHGREVKHTGDGMMAAFGSAADAVNCALTVKRDIATYNDTHEGEELLVRFGLNAGEPIAEDDDLFGLSVTLAARIGDWGEPGQVLCSNVVRELLLGKGFAFTSVGSAELKGLDEPVPLYEVR